MPTLDFKCEDCKSIFTKLLKKTRDTHPCPDCGGKGKRLWTGPPAIQFKGPGFYINDYKGK